MRKCRYHPLQITIPEFALELVDLAALFQDLDVVLDLLLSHLHNVHDLFGGSPTLVLDDGKHLLPPVTLALALARLDDVRVELARLGIYADLLHRLPDQREDEDRVPSVDFVGETHPCRRLSEAFDSLPRR